MPPAEVDGNATVIAAHGRHFLIRNDGGLTHSAIARGRQSNIVVGDRVVAHSASANQRIIERVCPRRNCVYRSDSVRRKSIAANLDCAFAVISGSPRFDEALLLKALLAIVTEGISAGVIATKADLQASFAAIEPRLQVYQRLGFAVYRLALPPEHSGLSQASNELDRLRSDLGNKQSLLLGQSGMGKSTLINALAPTANQQTAAISLALNSGRHTTTGTQAFQLPDGGTVLDSPGFQTFEIDHLTHWQISHAMTELAHLIGQCRFNDCQHLDEPGCVVRAAAAGGAIDPLRYRLFRQLVARNRLYRDGAARRR